MTQTRYDEPSLDKKCSTVGKAFPGIEVAVIDPETGEHLGPGEHGELCCRGYNVMKGYYKMPEETAKAIDKDGWLHSGDIGMMDEDGYYAVTGRLKDMIIRGGENIYPKEVEDFIHHIDGVRGRSGGGRTIGEVRRAAGGVRHPAAGSEDDRRGRRGPLPREDRLLQDPQVRAVHRRVPDDRQREDHEGEAEGVVLQAMAGRLTPNLNLSRAAIVSSIGVIDMPEKDVTVVLNEKGQELKKLFKDFDANIEQWKFAVEETKDGIRVEFAAKALFKSKSKKE